MNYEDILGKYLSNNKRIAHSISTGMFMRQYADIAGVDPDTAYITGILHDVAKELPNEEMIRLSTIMRDRNLYKIDYFDYKKANPSLLHGVAASEILYSDLNIKDIEILKAVAHHTTGGANLSMLSKFAFMADFIEPLREYKDSVKIRNIFVSERNFQKCLFLSYLSLLKNLVEKKRNICLESVEGYNECLLNII